MEVSIRTIGEHSKFYKTKDDRSKDDSFVLDVFWFHLNKNTEPKDIQSVLQTKYLHINNKIIKIRSKKELQKYICSYYKLPSSNFTIDRSNTYNKSNSVVNEFRRFKEMLNVFNT